MHCQKGTVSQLLHFQIFLSSFSSYPLVSQLSNHFVLPREKKNMAEPMDLDLSLEEVRLPYPPARRANRTHRSSSERELRGSRFGLNQETYRRRGRGRDRVHVIGEYGISNGRFLVGGIHNPVSPPVLHFSVLMMLRFSGTPTVHPLTGPATFHLSPPTVTHTPLRLNCSHRATDQNAAESQSPHSPRMSHRVISGV